MGRIRSLSATAHPQSELMEVVAEIAEHEGWLAEETGCRAGTDWQKLLEREDVDAIVVATPHKYLAPITAAALNAGKYVFCEKPGARNATEAEIVLGAAYGNWPPREPKSGVPLVPQNNGRLILGFTMRHYAAIANARELIAAGVIGEPMYVRARYGPGARWARRPAASADCPSAFPRWPTRSARNGFRFRYKTECTRRRVDTGVGRLRIQRAGPRESRKWELRPRVSLRLGRVGSLEDRRSSL